MIIKQIFVWGGELIGLTPLMKGEVLMNNYLSKEVDYE